MKKILGGTLILGSIICFSYFFFSPQTHEEREILVRAADYGGPSASLPKSSRHLFLYGGLILGIIGGNLIKNS